MQVYTGIVQRGSKRGTALGFPTVNIPLADESVSGIYAAKVKVGEEEYNAVAYADRKGKKLEAHIFDFPSGGGSASGGSAHPIDLYGWNIHIELLHKIRDNKKFSSDEQARATIGKDVEKAQAYFKK